MKEVLFNLSIPARFQMALCGISLTPIKALISLQDLISFLNIIFEMLFSLLKIFSIIMIFIFAFFLAHKIYTEEGMVIMPFETPKDENTVNCKGKAISDLLTAELLRIRRYHALDSAEFLVKLEDSSIPEPAKRSDNPDCRILDRSISRRKRLITDSEISESDKGYLTKTSFEMFDRTPIPREKKLNTLKIVPRSETIEYGDIPNIGTIGVAQTSLSFGKIIVALKRICPWTSPTPIMTGSMQIYGSLIIITACLEDNEVRTWEVRRKTRNAKQTPEEQIPSMMRDLAFKIELDLAKEGQKNE